MEPFSVDVHRSGGRTSLAFVGELDMAGALTLGTTLAPLAGVDHAVQVEVDCAGWTFVDAAGVRALLTWATRAGGIGTVRLHDLRPSVAHVLALCGALGSFEIGERVA